MLPAVVIDTDGQIGAEAFQDVLVRACAVLLRTGWDHHRGTDRYGDPIHPHLTEAGNRDLGAQQDRVCRAVTSGGVVDVDRVGTDEGYLGWLAS